MTKVKVLLIEDDPDQILLYSTKFKLEGYMMISAEDGATGIEMAKKDKPDIILLDMVMNNMDGIEALKQLKASKVKSIPVLLFTNLAKKDLVEEAKKFGAVGCIIKSDYTPGKVVEKVAEVLRK